MGTQGVVYRDLIDESVPETHLTLGADTTSTLHQGTTSTLHESAATTLLDAPTESHALALKGAKGVHPSEAGAAQIPHSKEVVDLGWNEPKEHVVAPLVGGLSNEDLWLLVRRFNKVRSLSRHTTPIRLTSFVANVPCEGDCNCPSWWPRSEHCR
jgi:hypothetical protein